MKRKKNSVIVLQFLRFDEDDIKNEIYCICEAD
jgi:hypothetical protein